MQIKRPQSVSLGIKIYLATFVLGIVNGFLSYKDLGADENMAVITQLMSLQTFLIVTWVIGVSINLVFLFFVSRGANWSRIVLAVFFVLGSFSIISNVIKMYPNAPAAVLSLVATFGQGWALYLFFSKESRSFFGQPSGAGEKPSDGQSPVGDI